MKKIKHFIAFLVIIPSLFISCNFGYESDIEKTEEETAREKTITQFQTDIDSIKTPGEHEITVSGFLDLEGLVQIGTILQNLTEEDKEPDFFISLDLSNTENLTTIYPFTFTDSLVLQKIILPSSIEKLDYFSFAGCSHLNSVIIQNTETIIENGAFAGCSVLDFSFVNSLDKYSSSNSGKILCNKEQTVLYSYPSANGKITSADLPDTITTIEDYAFAYCENLETITLSNTITFLGKGIFRDCTSLISCEIPQNITTLESESFFNCENLTNITLPATITSIGDYAFSNCKNLSALELPSNLALLGKGVFVDCVSLTAITLPEKITTLPDFLFQRCSNLAKVNLPDAIISIGTYVFSQCHKLESITLPQNLQEIGNFAFYNCKTLESLTIPVSLKQLGTDILSECTDCSYLFYLGTKNQWKELLKTGSLGIAVTVKTLI